MNEYQRFLEQKQKSITLSGFDIDESELNKSMFEIFPFDGRSNCDPPIATIP